MDDRNDYERGFIDGMSHQAKSSVDKAVNAISKREWVGLTKEEIEKCKFDSLNGTGWALDVDINLFYKSVEAKLKGKNT